MGIGNNEMTKEDSLKKENYPYWDEYCIMKTNKQKTNVDSEK
jgi:hypothetical protein